MALWVRFFMSFYHYKVQYKNASVNRVDFSAGPNTHGRKRTNDQSYN